MVFYDEPIQTVLITCRGHAEVMGRRLNKDNIITVNWHMPASFKPPLYAISIGKDRFSLGLIRSSGCFVVNFMDFSHKDAAQLCGTTTGSHTDKFRETGLSPVQADRVDCPLLGEALASLECEVIHEADAGDHVIFIGKVLGSTYAGEGNRLFHTGNRFVMFEGGG